MTGAGGFVAQFDSSSAMLRAMARFLGGGGYLGLGTMDRLGPLLQAADHLPVGAREFLHEHGSWAEAVPPEQLAGLRAEDLSRWMVSHYGAGLFPAVALGATSGAGLHLAAALGAPWLPQTLLVPVQWQPDDVDDLAAAMEWGARTGRVVVENNLELQLHHVHDPNQDRLRIQKMACFRLKRRVLGASIEEFLGRSCAGHLLLFDCRTRWPVARTGPRQYFQPGAPGGLRPEEYLLGGPRVRAFLAAQRSTFRSWHPEGVDAEAAEAEWGLEGSLAADARRFAQEAGMSVIEVTYSDPHELSRFVADLYGWWYRLRGRSADSVILESYILLDLLWVLKAGLIPYWSMLPVESSFQHVESWLEESGPRSRLFATLFPHGMDSAGLVDPDEVGMLLMKNAREARLLGVDPFRFPRDFGAFLRFFDELSDLPVAGSPPDPLTLAELECFVAEQGHAQRVGVRRVA